MNIIEFYKTAKDHIIQQGYQKEIDVVNERTFEDQSVDSFHNTFVYVVLNSGMKNQIAEKIYQSWYIIGNEAVNHPGKRKAIETCDKRCEYWFNTLKNQDSIEDKLSFLETLPWIGPITKYHLARNLGIDVAKPDRHLVKLAKSFNCSDVQKMCKYISNRTGDRIGVVDVILWRYCNLTLIDFEDPLIKAYLHPDNWGEGTENLSSQVDEIVYGDER